MKRVCFHRIFNCDFIFFHVNISKSLFSDFWPKYEKWTKINVQNEKTGQNLGKTDLFIMHFLGDGGKT
jgi:hypothetical protein